MMGDKQIQKAGEGSQQIQANQIIINQGITEERARQIVDEKIQEVVQKYSLEAHDVAEERIQIFSNELIPRLVRENLTDSLKDPSVQMMLLEAEKTAVGAERESDYELLSELLIHRVKKGADYTIKAGVNQAVKIVDEISDEALLALTVAHVVENFIPDAMKIEDGLKMMDDLFSKITNEELPNDRGWLDHLDVLNAVRLNAYGSLKKISLFYSETMAGYVDVGFEKDSEEHKRAIEILKAVGMPLDILVDHELREGYLRLGIVRRDKFDLLTLKRKVNLNGLIIKIPLDMQLTEQQKQALSDIYDMYEKDESKHKENIQRFSEMINRYESLKKVQLWWDAIQGSFSITSVGIALAQANAKRCDPRLPDLD